MRTGTLTITAAADSPSGNVAVGTTDALLGKFTVRAQGEDMEVRKMAVKIVHGGGSTDLTGNISVRSGDGTITYLTRSAATVAGGTNDIYDFAITNLLDLSTYIQLKSNADTVLAVYGNISSNATASDQYQAEIGNFYVKRLSSIDYTNVPDQTNFYPAKNLTVQTTSAVVAKNTAFGNTGKVAPGAANVKIGSFVVQGGAAEDAKVSAVNVKLSGTGVAPTNYTQNLRVMVNGVQQGTTIASPATSGNSFSVSVNVPKNTTVTFDVYADTITGGSGDVTTALAQNGVTVIGLSTSNTVSYPASGDLALQTRTLQGGTLTITKDSSSPSEQIVTAGTNGVLLGNWKFAADNEDLKLSKVTFDALTATGATSLAAVGNFATMYLKDGSTQIASASLVGNDVAFTFPTITIPASGNKILSLYADLTGSGVQSPATIVEWGIKSDTTPTDIDVTGSTGELGTDKINTGSADTLFAISNRFLYENSKPVIAIASDSPSGTKVPTAGDTVMKFTVTNSGTRDITIPSIVMAISSAGAAGTTATTVQNFALYDGTTKIASTELGIGADTEKLTHDAPATTVTFNNANDVSAAFDSLTISAGASKTFTLKADTSAIRAGVTSGTVSLTAKVDGSIGYSGSGITWNPGGFTYTYTPVFAAGAIANQTASDSYPVQGGTLQY